MCECERTTCHRDGDVEVSEGEEGNCALRLRNERVVNGDNWGRVMKDELLKLGHFVQGGQPSFERRHRLHRPGGHPYLEG